MSTTGELLIGNNILFGLVSSITYFIISLFTEMKFLHIIVGLVMLFLVQFGLGYAVVHNPQMAQTVYDQMSAWYKKFTTK
jgi:hypothetical protein